VIYIKGGVYEAGTVLPGAFMPFSCRTGKLLVSTQGAGVRNRPGFLLNCEAEK